jgi:hypothetical protein
MSPQNVGGGRQTETPGHFRASKLVLARIHGVLSCVPATFGFLVLCVGMAVGGPIQAQTMSEEVASLHRIVFERTNDFPDKDASFALAVRYIEGRDVPFDIVRGCALLNLAGLAARSPHDQTIIDEVERLQKRHCASATPGSHGAIGLATGCGYIDTDVWILQLEPGSWLEVTGAGIVVDRPSGRTFRPADWCGRKIALVTARVLDKALTGTSDRQVAQVFSWGTRAVESRRRVVLTWELFEIVGSTVEHAGVIELMEGEGSLWPTPQLPENYAAGPTVSVSSTGVIHWIFLESDRPPQIIRLGVR